MPGLGSSLISVVWHMLLQSTPMDSINTTPWHCKYNVFFRGEKWLKPAIEMACFILAQKIRKNHISQIMLLSFWWLILEHIEKFEYSVWWLSRFFGTIEKNAKVAHSFEPPKVTGKSQKKNHKWRTASPLLNVFFRIFLAQQVSHYMWIVETIYSLLTYVQGSKTTQKKICNTTKDVPWCENIFRLICQHLIHLWPKIH